MSRTDVAAGVVADDFTGATDIANSLMQGGVPTVLTVGPPRDGRDYGDAEAIVAALKTRSTPAPDAVAESVNASDALVRRGAKVVAFKYCSTFDSTPHGNIGPVADALLDRLDAPMTLHCPAFPQTGRRVFGGYLFAGDVLLSESGMRDHPLTPMRDANLVRVLQAQTPHPVGRIDLAVVREGRAAIAAALRSCAATGMRHAIVDAAADDDLRAIAGAAVDERLPLVCGASGIGLGLAAVLSRDPGPRAASHARQDPNSGARAAVLAGSCSVATRRQIAYARERMPLFDLSEASFDEPERRVRDVLAWADTALRDGPILIAAASEPERVAENQRRYGVAEASARVEGVLASVARGLRERGVARFVVAGGETSGAVVGGLHVDALRIGAPIAPGVPWTTTLDDAPIALALKSGNFGGDDFFVRALECAG